MLKVNGFEVPEHASYSSITTWLACGYQYYLSRVVKVAEQPAVWNIGGSAVHRATEEYDLALWSKDNA